jgi:cytochrome P450
VIAEMREYLEPLLEARRRGERRDDLMTLFADSEAAESLTGDEAIAYTLMMSISAYDTSANLIAMTMMYLLRHRDQWREILVDPSLVKNAAEEVMRYDNSVWNVMPRYALADIELHGQTIRKGDRVLSLLPGSGHDPQLFHSPEVFDIHRTNAKHHLGFGSGGHVCSGQWLARIEVQEAVTGVARRYPDMEIVQDDISWEPTFGGRNMVSLYVRPGGKPVGAAANGEQM